MFQFFVSITFSFSQVMKHYNENVILKNIKYYLMISKSMLMHFFPG